MLEIAIVKWNLKKLLAKEDREWEIILPAEVNSYEGGVCLMLRLHCRTSGVVLSMVNRARDACHSELRNSISLYTSIEFHRSNREYPTGSTGHPVKSLSLFCIYNSRKACLEDEAANFPFIERSELCHMFMAKSCRIDGNLLGFPATQLPSFQMLFCDCFHYTPFITRKFLIEATIR